MTKGGELASHLQHYHCWHRLLRAMKSSLTHGHGHAGSAGINEFVSRHHKLPTNKRDTNTLATYRELSFIFPHVEHVHHCRAISVPQKLHCHVCGGLGTSVRGESTRRCFRGGLWVRSMVACCLGGSGGLDGRTPNFRNACADRSVPHASQQRKFAEFCNVQVSHAQSCASPVAVETSRPGSVRWFPLEPSASTGGALPIPAPASLPITEPPPLPVGLSAVGGM